MNTETPKSAPWSTTTKLVVGLTIVAVLAAVVLYYRSIVSSLIFAIILSYLLRPIIVFLTDKTFLSWRLSTTLVFVVLLILLLGGMTGAGFAIAQQLTSLVRLLQGVIADLPQIAEDLSNFLAQFGYLGEVINLSDLANRILETLQPLLGQAGSLVGSLATGAAVSIGKIFIVLFVSYFLISETRKVNLIDPELFPDFEYDIRRMSRQLRHIWNTFFRGQIIIFMLVFVVYFIVLSILGVRYAIILGAMAGFAVFVPYVGLWLTVIVMALVTLLQPSNYFGLVAWQYSALVVGIALALNFIFDNYITPRFYGSTLDIHPAAVLISALVAANLFGLLGIFLAAPSFATLKLLGIYVLRKMFDLDPWPFPEEEFEPIEYPWYRWGRKIVQWVREQISRLRE
jgi:predicted PurR-regulated permease PerM